MQVFRQFPEFFFVVLITVIVFMLVFILLQHSKISVQETKITELTTALDKKPVTVYTECDISAPPGAPSQEAVETFLARVEANKSPNIESPTVYSDPKTVDPRGWPFSVTTTSIPNPATFNTQAELSSGGGQT